MRSLVIACGSGAIAPHAPTLVVNGAPLDPNASGVVVVGGGGGGSWWPADAEFMWDASVLASLTLSGSDVTAWADQSANARDLGSPSSSVTYSATGLRGGPCVVIADAGQLSTASVDLTAPTEWTFWGVFEATSTDGGKGLLNSQSGSASRGIFLGQVSSTQCFGGAGFVGGNFVRTSANTAAHAFIARCRSSGTPSLLYDGSEVVGASSASPASQIGSSPIVLGYVEGLWASAAKIGCLGGVARIVDDTELAAIAAGLAAGWPP